MKPKSHLEKKKKKNWRTFPPICLPKTERNTEDISLQTFLAFVQICDPSQRGWEEIGQPHTKIHLGNWQGAQAVCCQPVPGCSGTAAPDPLRGTVLVRAWPETG